MISACFLVRVTGFEPAASWSQRRSNLVLHVHELHLALSTPGILLSGALFSTVSTSSGGGCGQLCGRMEMLPWIAADSPSPGSVWIVALFCQIVKAVLDISTLTFCVAVDKEIRNHGRLSAGKTVKLKFLGTGMISVMPVPLLAAHPRECSPQGRTRYVPSACACRWTCQVLPHRPP